MILGLIAGAVWFVVFLAANVVILRVVDRSFRPRANQWMFLVGLAGVSASVPLLIATAHDSVLTQGNLAAATLCALLVYGSLFVLYMPFYYVVAASLSVKTIVLLGRASGGALPVSALQEEVVGRRVVGRRLATMTENGFLSATPRGYALTAKGQRIATVFDTIKRIWKLGPGG